MFKTTRAKSSVAALCPLSCLPTADLSDHCAWEALWMVWNWWRFAPKLIYIYAKKWKSEGTSMEPFLGLYAPLGSSTLQIIVLAVRWHYCVWFSPLVHDFLLWVLKCKKYILSNQLLSQVQFCLPWRIKFPSQYMLNLLAKYHKYFSQVYSPCASLICWPQSFELYPAFTASPLHLQIMKLSYPLVEVFVSREDFM